MRKKQIFGNVPAHCNTHPCYFDDAVPVENRIRYVRSLHPETYDFFCVEEPVKRLVQGRQILFWCATEETRRFIDSYSIPIERIAGIMDRKAGELRQNFPEFRLIDSTTAKTCPDHDICVVINQASQKEVLAHAESLKAKNIFNYYDFLASRFVL